MKTPRPVVALALAVVLAAAGACSSTKTTYVDDLDAGATAATDAGFDSAPPADASLGPLAFRPATTYSGIDNTHAFQVPVAVYDAASDLVVTVDDPAAADVVPAALVSPTKNGVTDTGVYFLVRPKKAGTIVLTARSNGETATSKLVVTSYAADRFATGERRYTTGEGGDPPCTDCHGGSGGIDHSPAALATVPDDGVAVTITTGVSPGGNVILVDGKPGHKWTVTGDELPGLVTYLRALAPRGIVAR